MRQICFIGLLMLLGRLSGAQGFTDSNLPIVLINTDGEAEIPDEPRILASMKIIYRGPGTRNYVSDQNDPACLDYDGRIEIEIRGASSQAFEKKQYGFTTLLSDNISNNNVSLLGMPKENDWVLNGMVYDSAMIRDYLCYNLSRQLGNYASRTAYCEVMINNDFKGIYVLQEKIKADNNRIDVKKITPGDNYLPDVSGGYITKADKVSVNEPIAWTMYTWYLSPVNYIHHLPKPENATSLQTNYIRSQFEDLERIASINDASIDHGFPSVIDVPSFVDFMIINELASNPDAYMYSTYFHKDRNGKLRAGPIWDLDLTFGNDLFFWGFDRSWTEGWHFEEGLNDGSTFWRDLFYTSEFRCYLSRRWNELIQPGQPLDHSRIEAYIDEIVSTIGEAVERDYLRWDRTANHHLQISDIKSFIIARIEWMTANLGPFSACNNVFIPPLVITKIMYSPEASEEFPVSDDLEFIEITNNGDQVVTLTGIYFSGTGLVYRFPDNATLAAKTSLKLASNRTAFMAKYGFVPFGQFTRHLSDKDQKLVLADGYGNVIDSVHYYHTPPWPNADCLGYYLQLEDPDLDNSIPENWISSNGPVLAANDLHTDGELILYPNPVHDIMRTYANSEIRSLSLFDIQGQLLKTTGINSRTCELDLSQYARGTYVIRIITTEKIHTRLIVKD